MAWIANKNYEGWQDRRSLDDLYNRLSGRLRLPGHFGRNLDARGEESHRRGDRETRNGHLDCDPQVWATPEPAFYLAKAYA